jgi:hypothetical protein
VNHGQPVYPLPSNVALGLFNPDPLLDVAYYTDGKVQVYQNSGNGQFEFVGERSVLRDVKKMEWRKSNNVVAGIADPNSWGDLVVSYSDGRSETIAHELMLRMSSMLSSEGFSSSPSLTPLLSFHEVWRSERNQQPANLVEVTDIDNDGHNEVIYPFYGGVFDTTSRIVIYENVGNNQYLVDWDTVFVRGNGGPLAITDIDNDGHKEFVGGYECGTLGCIAVVECFGPSQYRYYQTNIGVARPIFKVLETDINHNGVKELTVLTSDGSLSYDQTFIYIAEYAGKGPGPNGWTMAFNQTIARISEYVFDMAVGQVDGAGWDEIVLGDGAGLGGPPEWVTYLKYSGTPGVFAWRPHFIEAGLPATCTTPKFLNLDADRTRELLIGGVGPLGHGSLYALKYASDTTWQTVWIDSAITTAPLVTTHGTINGTGTVLARGLRTSGPNLLYSKIEIFQDQGAGYYTRVGSIPLEQDTAVYLAFVLKDIDGDGKANIIGARTRETYPAFDNRLVDLEQDSTTTDVHGQPEATPTEILLSRNFPNPFNPSTTIAFVLGQKAMISLEVFNMMGQKIISLACGQLESGHHEISWDGRNNYGIDMPSGVYFARFTVSNELGRVQYTKISKLVLMK